ncbi:hypothetical protein ACVIWV_009949 [Bradyrhizobium diazoefficiens]|uniref:hypothetical protein n=1 Tax=Bradyrhizobium diazoefficiens TaxID=1355477 RepID=UPI001B8D308E|nr:hypothetical protein [Bradyrhizobium diazoefficiens]MBR0868388.1 hypothetical protein [Bradyrhizobium diazoefficiens]MBR0892317.1 hypothetical protein [Bradyrhizobium diazoefficiens]MBR0924020.1 hypothetical protein [Bradyrhizobium diazoefficiens]
MQGDDLAIFGILWGTAIAFALAAVTMVDSGRKRILAALWGVSGGFLIVAVFWSWIAEKWPALRELANGLAENRFALNLVGTAIFSLLLLDFAFRSGWLGKTKHHRDESAHQAVQALQARFDLLSVSSAAHDDSEVRSLLEGLQKNTSQNEAALTGFMHISKRSFDNIFEDLKKITEIERNVQRNNIKIVGYDSDLPATMEILMETLGLSILFDALPEPPSFEPDIADLNHRLMQEETAKAFEYQTETKRILSSTQWRADIASIISDSVLLGEDELRRIPEEGRPNIDPLDLRHYMIVRKTSEQIAAFVQSERKEAASRYVGYLERIRQRYWDRRQIDRNPN